MGSYSIGAASLDASLGAYGLVLLVLMLLALAASIFLDFRKIILIIISQLHIN